MYRDYKFEFLLSSVAPSYAPVAGETALTQDRMGKAAAQAQQGTANASHPSQPDTEARLARVEARQEYADASLAYMEACRRYTELRLEEAFDDVAKAGEIGLNLLKW
jgi:hypothetical protein